MTKPLLVASLLALSAAGCSSTNLGEPPDSTFDASTYEGVAPLDVVFVVTIADDTDYTVKQYEWDFDGDGTVDETTATDKLSVTVPHTYTEVGEFSPDLRVVFKEADAWTRPLLNNSLSQKITVTEAP